MSAPAGVDADRSLPVPASPYDWLAPGATNPGCERDDTTALLDALNVLMSSVVGERQGRFLRRVDRSFSRDLVLHVIPDDHGTHDRETVPKWLAGHPRFRLRSGPRLDILTSSIMAIMMRA